MPWRCDFGFWKADFLQVARVKHKQKNLQHRPTHWHGKFSVLRVKVVGGKIPDGRNVMKRARGEAEEYESFFNVPISG